FHARVWAIGQVESARAAVEQLKHRAEAANSRAEKTTPWPEFSEYGCFACHKNLQVDSPRQLAGYGKRLPGALPFGNWYLPLTVTYAKLAGLDQKELAAIRELKSAME